MGKDKTSKKRGWFRFVVYLILIVIAFLLGGFLTFANNVSKLRTPSSVPVADGIVIWTGKGGDRLSAAGKLLRDERGERLLVSGVNKALTEDAVYELLMIDPEQGECCVDIDYKALDTIGNARETHNWLTSMGYEHIILVTSAYHMPRAEIEISALSGRVRITPYPVAQSSETAWWKDKVQRKRLSQEYGKLLLTNLRQSGNEKQREAPELPDMPEPPEKSED